MTQLPPCYLVYAQARCSLRIKTRSKGAADGAAVHSCVAFSCTAVNPEAIRAPNPSPKATLGMHAQVRRRRRRAQGDKLGKAPAGGEGAFASEGGHGPGGPGSGGTIERGDDFERLRLPGAKTGAPTSDAPAGAATQTPRGSGGGSARTGTPRRGGGAAAAAAAGAGAGGLAALLGGKRKVAFPAMLSSF